MGNLSGRKLVMVAMMIVGFAKSELSEPSIFETSNDTFREGNVKHNPTLRAPYQLCGGKATNGILKRVEVIPCDSDVVCPLVKGTNVTLDAEFISNVSSNTLVGSIFGQMTAFWPIQFGSPEDLCLSNQVKCPIIPGKVYHYHTTVFVKHSFPRMKLRTKILLEGDNHKEIACALIPVEIVSPPRPRYKL